MVLTTPAALLGALFCFFSLFGCYHFSPDGNPATEVKSTGASDTPTALCFERLNTAGSQITFVGFPSNRSKAVIGTQGGVVSLVSLPLPGTGKTIKKISTWLDISDRVVYSGEQGFLGLAFHPRFLQNGRFFVSYICDSNKHPDCKGPCPCDDATGCNPRANPKAGCRFNTVVSEYWAGPKPKSSTKVVGSEVRRILTFARPFSNHNGGDIFFDTSGLLYYTSGDGGNGGDPWNFAQKGNTFLGKILRLNVDARTSSTNYTIPRGNPFIKMSSTRHEIFALGLRNPWRCTVDSVTKSIFCGDVGQNRVEEVNQIYSGRNYGWRNYEGTAKYSSSRAPAPSTPDARMIGKLTFPVFEYTHSSLSHGSGAVIGGVVYRATRNKCLQGKYLYNDYFYPFWVGNVLAQNPKSWIVSVKCAPDSPIKCGQRSNGQDSVGNIIFSWGLDSKNEAYVLSDSGIFRLTDLSRCNVSC